MEVGATGVVVAVGDALPEQPGAVAAIEGAIETIGEAAAVVVAALHAYCA
jgi:hypothetical protein